jgi:multidrug efflux system outer membrane protein
MMSRRANVGSASQLQLTQVETLLIQARALVLQLEQDRDTQQHALALLVGAPVDWPEGGERAPTAMATPAPGLPSTLLTHRPDIAAAEHRLQAANANIGVARAAYFPQISLTGSFGSASAELDGLFKPGSRAWSYGPSISLPLFDAGRRRELQTLAEARRDEALASYDKTVQSAFRDVSDALSALHWLDGQQQVASDAVRVQGLRARLSLLRYDSGASSYLDVLDAQRDLLSAEQQQVRAQHAVQAARVSLFLALGGATAPAPATPSPAISGPHS